MAIPSEHEYIELRTERDELKSILSQANHRVIPGECDTGDALYEMLFEARADANKCRELLQQEIELNAELVKERDQARAKAERLWARLDMYRGLLIELDSLPWKKEKK